jgi:hypothetical protein
VSEEKEPGIEAEPPMEPVDRMFIRHGNKGVASWIMQHYGGRFEYGHHNEITENHVSYWRNGKRMPSRNGQPCLHFFPAPEKAGFRVSLVKEWVEEHLLDADVPESKSPKEEYQLLKNRELAVKVRNMERSESNQWVKRSEHRASLLRSMAVVRSRVIVMVERVLPVSLKGILDMEDIGLTEVQREQIISRMAPVWPQQIDAMQNDLAAFGKVDTEDTEDTEDTQDTESDNHKGDDSGGVA